MWIVLKQNPFYTYNKFSCHLTESLHVLYNVKLYDKCKNELMDSCWNNDNLFLGQEDLRLDIWHNIAINISGVVTHDLTVDTHTLLPFPYQMLWHKYDTHVK